MANWVNDIAEARSRMALIQEQQLKLPESVLQQFPIPLVPRVFQLDAESIDAETFELLRTQLVTVFSFGPLLSLRLDYQDEMNLLLRGVLYKYSIWDHHQSIGDRMQNLVYRDEAAAALSSVTPLVVLPSTAPHQMQKLMHAMLTLVVPYLVRKLEQRISLEDWNLMPPHTWKYQFAWYFHKLSTFIQGATLLNMFVFLGGGYYRSLTDRILKLRLVRGNLRTERRVYLGLMNSNLRWEDTLIFLGRISMLLRMSSLWRNAQGVTSAIRNSFVQPSAGSGSSTGHGGNVCVACLEAPTLPRLSNCNHTYCYYCVTRRMLMAQQNGDSGFACLRCGTSVTAVHE